MCVAADRRGVVGQVGAGAGDLADRVGAGVDRLLHRSCRRRRRLAPVVRSSPSICRLNLPGSVVGLRSLTTFERAGLAGVGDRADDVVVASTVTFSGPARRRSPRRRRASCRS